MRIALAKDIESNEAVWTCFPEECIQSLGKEKNADVRVVEKEAIGVCPRTSWGFGRAFTMQQKVVRIVAGIVAWCG